MCLKSFNSINNWSKVGGGFAYVYSPSYELLLKNSHLDYFQFFLHFIKLKGRIYVFWIRLRCLKTINRCCCFFRFFANDCFKTLSLKALFDHVSYLKEMLSGSRCATTYICLILVGLKVSLMLKIILLEINLKHKSFLCNKM